MISPLKQVLRCPGEDPRSAQTVWSCPPGSGFAGIFVARFDRRAPAQHAPAMRYRHVFFSPMWQLTRPGRRCWMTQKRLMTKSPRIRSNKPNWCPKGKLQGQIKVELESQRFKLWAGLAEFPGASPKPMSPPRRAKYPPVYRPGQPLHLRGGVGGAASHWRGSFVRIRARGGSSFANRSPTMCDAAGDPRTKEVGVRSGVVSWPSEQGGLW